MLRFNYRNKKRYAGLMWTKEDKFDYMDTKVSSIILTNAVALKEFNITLFSSAPSLLLFRVSRLYVVTIVH